MKRKGKIPAAAGVVAACAMLGAGELPGGPLTVEASAAGYYQVLGLDRERRDFDFSATLLATNRPGNLFFPGEQPEITVQVRNTGAKALNLTGEWVLVPWGNRQYPGSCWHSTAERFGEERRIPVRLELPAGGFADLKPALPLPERFGGYALLLDLGKEHGRRLVCSFARSVRNEARPGRFPRQAVELFDPEVMERLGLSAVRFGVPYNPEGTPQREQQERELRELCAKMKKHHIVGVLEIGAGTTGFPMGVVRPHLLENDEMVPEGKADYAWHPEYDEDFRRFVGAIVREYGWPRGPVNGIKLWNEPWEGLSIAGWGADMVRYRELYRIMGEATRAAEQASGNRVLVGGCDSSSNTFDKLFPDGSGEFTPYFDFCSIHYQGLTAPSLYRQWIDRPGRDRVLIWDTESWTANADDTLAMVIAANRAAGYDRSMGFYCGYAFGNYEHHAPNHKAQAEVMTAAGPRQAELPLYSFPMAAALGAAQKFIGEREFDRLVYPEGLPYAFRFRGLDGNADDATVVIAGDLGSSFADYSRYAAVRPLSEVRGKARRAAELDALKPGTPQWEEAKREAARRLPFFRIGDDNLIAEWKGLLKQPWGFEGVTFRFPASPGAYAVYDRYGNEIAPQGGGYVLDLGNVSHFVRPLRAGGAAEMDNALRQGQLEGMTPVELKAYDFLDPVTPGAVLRLQIHNLLNRELTGTLKASVGRLKLDCPEQLTLKPFETREVAVKVTAGAADPDNLYPGSFVFDAGKDGAAELRDTMRVNRIARKTIAVDGNLSDWAGVLPQKVSGAEGPERSEMEAAWLPFEKLSSQNADGQAEAKLAADDRYFYFCCRVNDPRPDAGTFRFETLDPDQFFYPEVSYSLDRDRTYTVTVEQENGAVTAAAGVEAPEGGRRLSSAIRPESDRMRFDFTLPADRGTLVTVYFPYGDFRADRNAEVRMLDSATGWVLAAHPVRRLREGGFFRFLASGKVSLEVQNFHRWEPGSGRLAGIFFDPAAEAASGNSARFLGVDEERPGLWRGRYGSSGWILPGENRRRLSDGIGAVQRHDRVRLTHRWPEGVRRFSYRKWAVLPDGSDGGFFNIQIAFNSIPADRDPVMLDRRPGVPAGFINRRTSDREFALNKVADRFGGGTEIWRLEVPDAPRKHFYPRQPKAAWEGAVKDGRLAIRSENGVRIVEAAIPWTEMPEVKALVDAGKPVKFSFRANRAGGAPVEFARGRSASYRGGMSFHPDWKPCYANEIEFAFEPKEER